MRRSTTTFSCWSRRTTSRDPELSIVIPALNEELTIGDFVDWCQEGLASRRRRRRDPDRRQLHRPHRRDRARARRPRAADAEARARARLHRRAPVHPRAATSSWATPTAPTTSASSQPFVERFREGYEFVMGSRWKGYDRARLDAVAAPLLRHAGHDLDPEPALFEQVLGHPLRHARHHARRARAHGSAVAVVGVRVGDGAEVGAHGAAHDRGARSASSRTAKAGSATTSEQAGSRRGRRPGSTCARCSSTARTSSS